MERGEVAENQRQRMHGAMVEAVAEHGYEATSVKQVISLAGVSRRSFYEQFSNKEECFVSTLELLGRRAAERAYGAFRSHEGEDVRVRMEAALHTIAQLAADNPKSAHMALVDASAAGGPGLAMLTEILGTFERAIGRSFRRTPGGHPLPKPVVRGVLGGLHHVVLTHVYQRRADELPALVQDMLDWTLLFDSPAARRLHEDDNAALSKLTRMPHPAAARASSVGALQQRKSTAAKTVASQRRPAAATTTALAERSRLLESALEMIALEGYGNLSPLRIVDRAGSSIDAFFALFGDTEGCMLTALADLSEKVREAVDAAEIGSQEAWAPGVRRAMHALMRYFASHPSHAQMLTTGAFEIGPGAIGLSLELAAELAHTLTEGAPPNAGNLLVPSGIAGAIWHTLRCHTATHEIDALPEIADDLTFIALVPFLGAKQAVEALHSQHAHNLTRLSGRSSVGNRTRAAL